MTKHQIYTRYVLIGLGLSLGVGLIYFVLLGEPYSAFYPFAVLAFVGSPCVAGVLAALEDPERKVKLFFTTAGPVLGIVCILFLLVYALLPPFDRTSVQLPEFCDGSYADVELPSPLTFEFADIMDTGIRLTDDGQTVVVAQIDDMAPHSTEVKVIDTVVNPVLRTMDFSNDTLMAAVSDGVVYLFNAKLGYLIDADSGALKENILVIDNYGGLSQSDRPIISRASDGNWYVETSAVISSWGVDGSVRSRPHLTFNSIARGCFIDGQTEEVIQL